MTYIPSPKLSSSIDWMDGCGWMDEPMNEWKEHTGIVEADGEPEGRFIQLKLHRKKDRNESIQFLPTTMIH